MVFHRLLVIIMVWLLAASCILAVPLLHERARDPATRDLLFVREVLPLNDAVTRFKASISIIKANFSTSESATVSRIDAAKKATDDLKASYDNFHANLEALKASKKAVAMERGFPFGGCRMVKEVGGIIKVRWGLMQATEALYGAKMNNTQDVLVLVDVIKSAVEGEPIGVDDTITVVIATLSIITEGAPSLLALALSICLPF